MSLPDIPHSNIPFKYQVNLPWNTLVGLPKTFQRKTNRKKLNRIYETYLVSITYILAPGRFDWNFREVILKLILMVDCWRVFCEIVIRWISLDLSDDKSTSVQGMACSRQATSHLRRQCWLRSMSPYSVTSPLWFNKYKQPSNHQSQQMCNHYIYSSGTRNSHWYRKWSVRYVCMRKIGTIMLWIHLL